MGDFMKKSTKNKKLNIIFIEDSLNYHHTIMLHLSKKIILLG